MYIDCLTLTVSAEQEAAAQTLEALRRVKTELGLKTVLGVSNISFGLPARPLVNQSFLTMAMTKGLDLPIINPNLEAMMAAVRVYHLLVNTDPAARAAQAAETSGGVFASDPGREARDWFVNQVDPAALAEILLDDLVTNIGSKYSASSPALVYLVSTNLTTPNQNTWIEHLKAVYYSDYEIVYTDSGAIDFAACMDHTR